MLRLGFLILFAACCRTAGAGILTVARDGSGDYTTIQPAVNAAAPGDTVLIHSGRYTDTVTLVYPAIVVQTHIAVETDNLTLLGADPGQVVIGPESPMFEGLDPKGIAVQVGVTGLTVEGLRVENTVTGVLTVDPVAISDCHFSGNRQAITLASVPQTLIRDSSFESNDGAVFANVGSAAVTIEDCSFYENDSGVCLAGTVNGLVRRCSFDRGSVGVQFDRQTTGSVEECTFEDVESTGLGLTFGASMNAVDNRIMGGDTNVICTSDSHITGDGNLFYGGSIATLFFSDHGTASLTGGQILNTGAWSVQVNAYTEEPIITLELTGNYWGTPDPAQIEAWILDGNDDSSLKGVVEFEPFFPSPVSTRAMSFGDLKSGY